MDGYDDARVAAVAAGCMIGFTLLTAYVFDADTGVLVRTLPLVPYVGYLFTRQTDLPAAVDTTRNWSALTVVVTLGALAYYAV